jgi:hypothetical protein
MIRTGPVTGANIGHIEMTKQELLNAVAEYNPVQTLALALAVYEQFGFVRSGEGYNVYDQEGKFSHVVKDTKTQVMDMMRNGVVPHTTYVAEAEAIKDKFEAKFMMKKFGNGLTDFENSVAKAFAAGNSLTSFQVAIIASIPNMNKIDEKRKTVENRIEEVRFTSEHFGEMRHRYDLEVEVLDCKYIQNSGVYMITAIHANKDIIKFWWRDQPDISDIIEGKTIRIRGTVNRHELGKYTLAKETMFNRVKILL